MIVVQGLSPFFIIISSGDLNTITKQGEVYIFTRCVVLGSIVATSLVYLGLKSVATPELAFRFPDGILRQRVVVQC